MTGRTDPHRNPQGPDDELDEMAQLAGQAASYSKNGGPSPDLIEKLKRQPTPRSCRPRVAEAPVIPGYEILEELGHGGMGVVYKARSLRLNRLVAIKMILPSMNFGMKGMDRFRWEAEAVARLQHPYIVQIFDIGEHDGHLYLSLEYVDGKSLEGRMAEFVLPRPNSTVDDEKRTIPSSLLRRQLASFIQKTWPRSPLRSQVRIVASFMRMLAQAAAHAHSRGVVHQDLKPANVLLTRDGIPKMADFGLAKKLNQETGKAEGDDGGTPLYMAPEQVDLYLAKCSAGSIHDARQQVEELRKRIDCRTDVYALGVILYQMLLGRPPFLESDLPTGPELPAPTSGSQRLNFLEWSRSQEPKPPRQLNPWIPRDLEAICLRSLHKDPAQRYDSGVELAEDLRRVLEVEPVAEETRRIGRMEKLGKWAWRRPLLAAAIPGGGFVLMVATVVLYLLMLSAKQDAELQKGKLDQQERLAFAMDDMTALIVSAQKSADEAEGGKDEAWTAVERDAHSALKLITAEPGLAKSPLAQTAHGLLTRAQGHLAGIRMREEHRSRLKRLKECSGNAAFFVMLFSGLELQDCLDRAHEAAVEGLSLFGVKGDNEGPPSADARFYKPEEVRLITACCYELLLIDAEVLARPRAKDAPGGWHGRLRQALRLLDRAARLGKDLQTYSGLARRADYLVSLGEADEARRARRAAEMTAPSLAADYFLIGMEHCRRDEFKDAMKPLANALRLQPGHYGAEYLLAVCRLRQRRFQEAKEGLCRCLEQRPGFLWPYLVRGYAEIELGEFGKAEEDFEMVLRNPPDATASYIALVNRSVLAMRRQLWDDALSDLKQAITKKPEAIAGYINLALAQRQRAEVPPSQVSTLLLAPQGAFALLALEAHKRQALAEAVSTLDEAIRRQPGVARLYHERGRLSLQRDDLRGAREDFARSAALAPNLGIDSTLAGDLIELARLLHRGKEHGEAVQVYKAVLQVRPDQTLAHRLMAEPLLELRRYREAGEALDRYLATTLIPVGRPATPQEVRRLSETLKARGLVHVQQQDFRAAIDSYTQGLSAARDAELLALRGWAYLMFNAPHLALPDFNEALALRPGFGDAQLGRADARMKQGQVKEALADVEEGLRHGQATSRMLYNAARVYSQAVPHQGDRAARPRQPPGGETSYEGRAVALLRRALAQLPPGERAAFWRDYVEADGALNPIRHNTTMWAWKAAYMSSGR